MRPIVQLSLGGGFHSKGLFESKNLFQSRVCFRQIKKSKSLFQSKSKNQRVCFSLTVKFFGDVGYLITLFSSHSKLNRHRSGTSSSRYSTTRGNDLLSLVVRIRLFFLTATCVLKVFGIVFECLIMFFNVCLFPPPCRY